MSIKILCTRKSIKQQISYFSYALHSKQAHHENYHMHVLYNFLLSTKINKNHQLKTFELHFNNFSQNMPHKHFS
jgi:hypothetical protein